MSLFYNSCETNTMQTIIQNNVYIIYCFFFFLDVLREQRKIWTKQKKDTVNDFENCVVSLHLAHVKIDFFCWSYYHFIIRLECEWNLPQQRNLDSIVQANATRIFSYKLKTFPECFCNISLQKNEKLKWLFWNMLSNRKRKWIITKLKQWMVTVGIGQNYGLIHD